MFHSEELSILRFKRSRQRSCEPFAELKWVSAFVASLCSVQNAGHSQQVEGPAHIRSLTFAWVSVALQACIEVVSGLAEALEARG
jgi:hypothetical protein